MRRMALFITSLAIMLVSVAFATETPTAEQPKYTAGDYWVYTKDLTGTQEKESTDAGENEDFKVTFVSQDEDGTYHFFKDGTHPYKKNKFLTLITNKVKGFPGLVLEFPLTSGKCWSRDYDSAETANPVKMMAKYSVEGYEQITVPAGTFWAYRIEVSRVTAKRGSVVGNTTYWYAPTAKNIIKAKGVLLKEYKTQ